MNSSASRNGATPSSSGCHSAGSINRPFAPLLHNRGKLRVPPVHLTNEGTEWRREYKTIEDMDYIEVDQIQIPNPELGPLERRVDLSYDTAIERGIPNETDMAYWFNTPEEGWKSEPRQVPKAVELPTEEISAESDLPGGIHIDKLKEGQQMKGTITAHYYYHGIRVALGASHDGLIPVEPHEWEFIRDLLEIGDSIPVVVFQTREPSLWRWPVQLVLNSELPLASTVHPERWSCPIDHTGRTFEEVQALSGREYKVRSFLVDESLGQDEFQSAGFGDVFGAKAVRPEDLPEGTPLAEEFELDAAALADA